MILLLSMLLYLIQAKLISDDILLINPCHLALLSASLGGLLTVIFPSDLFLPLIPAAAFSFAAFIAVYFFVSEPVCDDTNSQPSEIEERPEIDEAEQLNAPEKLDKLALANIIVGALIDNVGSLGIVREYIYSFCSMSI